MDKPISVGDLVMVVKPSCCIDKTGAVGKVTFLYRGAGKCPKCHTEHLGIPSALVDGIFGGYRLSWLKRIPPLEELDDVKQSEELHA